MAIDWKRFARRETLLALLVLVGAAALVYLYQERGDVSEELRELEGKLPGTRQAIVSMGEERDGLTERIAALTAEVGQLESEPETRTLPTQTEALGLSIALTDYVTEENLDLTGFTSEQVSVPTGAETQTAIGYTLALRGEPESLVGVLDLVQDTPSTMVQSLGLARDAAAERLWVLNLSVAALYE